MQEKKEFVLQKRISLRIVICCMGLGLMANQLQSGVSIPPSRKMAAAIDKKLQTFINQVEQLAAPSWSAKDRTRWLKDVKMQFDVGVLTLTHLGLGTAHLPTLVEYINALLDGYDKKIQMIYLSNNKLTSIAGLKGLSNKYNVMNLDVSVNGFSDLSMVAQFQNLESLFAFENNITSIAPVKPLKNLTSLNLFKNKISSLDPVKGLVHLEELVMPHNRIKKIGSVANLTKLRTLNVANNLVVDVSAITHLHKLEFLNVSHNNITSIRKADFAKLTKLSFVNLAHNHIVHIEPGAFANCKNLHMISIAGNPVADDVKKNPSKYGIPATVKFFENH